MLRVTQSLSEAGGKENEDRIWHNDSVFVVLDGSTSLNNSQYTSSWFNDVFLQGFTGSISKGEALADAINAGILTAREQYVTPKELDALPPSAAGIFVQEIGNQIEVLTIGDCTGLFFMSDGEYIKIYDKGVSRLDDAVLNECVQLREKTGKSISELMKTEQIREHLVANRKLMNHPNGYRILTPDMPLGDFGKKYTFPAEKLRRIVLFSDGFDLMEDKFHAPSFSLKELYKELRYIEQSASSFDSIPRFKISDDASAIVAEYVQTE